MSSQSFRITSLIFVLLAAGAGVPPAQAGTTSANLNLLKSDSPDPVVAGALLTYTLTVSSKGPDSAVNASLSDPLPVGTTFQSLTPPAGWTCGTPAVGATGTVTCTNPSFAPGSDVFTLVVTVDVGLAGGTILSNTANVTSDTPDPDTGDNEATEPTTVQAAPPPPPGNPTISKVGSPASVTAGDGITYTITYDPVSLADSVNLSDALSANLNFTSLTPPAEFTCTTPAPGTNGTIDCNATSLSPGSYVFTLNVATSFDTPAGPLANTAFSVADIDGASRPASDSETTTVSAASTFTASKTVTGDFFAGGAITYTVVLTNLGPLAQFDHAGDEFTDVLPSGLTLVSASASSGTPFANVGLNTVTWNGAIPGNSSVTITIQATINATTGTISNQGTVNFDADGNGTNESTLLTDDPGTGTAADPTAFTVGSVIAIPTLGEFGLLGLGLGIAGAAAAALRRRRRRPARDADVSSLPT